MGRKLNPSSGIATRRHTRKLSFLQSGSEANTEKRHMHHWIALFTPKCPGHLVGIFRVPQNAPIGLKKQRFLAFFSPYRDPPKFFVPKNSVFESKIGTHPWGVAPGIGWSA